MIPFFAGFVAFFGVLYAKEWLRGRAVKRRVGFSAPATLIMWNSRALTPEEIAWLNPQALPDKPMHYSTLDELLGPTVDEP